jgi:hypothetical protein
MSAALILALLMAPTGRALAQTPLRLLDEAASWRDVAQAVPLGSRVKVETTEGRRYSGTLMQVSDSAIVIKRATRLPEPAVTVTFGQLARLERDRGGFSVAKALGIGLAAGAGAVAMLIVMAFALED